MSPDFLPKSYDSPEIRSPNTTLEESPVIHLIVLFDFIYFIDLISVSVLLLTAYLSPRIRRASTWYAAIGTGLISSTANLLNLGHQTDSPPTVGSHRCLFQASLIYASAVLGSLYTVAFILQVYMTLSAVRDSTKIIPRKHVILLHAVPILCFVVAFIGFLMFCIHNPTTLQRTSSGLYCHISSPGASEIAGGVSLISMIITIILDCLIIAFLRRASGPVRSAPQEDEVVSKDAITRVIVFALVPILPISASAYSYFYQRTTETAAFSILLSTIPLIVVILFGSQKDILRVWTSMRCVRNSRSQSS